MQQQKLTTSLASASLAALRESSATDSHQNSKGVGKTESTTTQ
jgi:hypothetical protein